MKTRTGKIGVRSHAIKKAHPIHQIFVAFAVVALVGCAEQAAQTETQPNTEPAAQTAVSGTLVFGASGKTGAKIVDLLLAQGEPVTAFVRPTSDRSRLEGRDINYAVGDAMNTADVDAAVAQARPRVIINTIGGRGSTAGFWDGIQLNINNAAKQNGVQMNIFLSSVGVGDSKDAYSPEAIAQFKDSLAERVTAEEHMKTIGIDYVIIRTGVVARPGTPATGQARLTEDRSVLSAVTRWDLAELVVDCIDNESCWNKTFAAMDDTLSWSREEE